MYKKNNMQRWGCVYRLTNTVNNKVYIGKTVHFKERMWKHKSGKLNTPLSQAIQKYGWDIFKQEILIDEVPEEDLPHLEQSYMEVENTVVPNGYNLTKRGGRVYFQDKYNMWRTYGPDHEHIGLYLTEEKAIEALEHYKDTGERMKPDNIMRKRGTGTIEKRGNSFRARIKIDKKFYRKTCGSEQECEEWLRLIRDS